MTNPTDPHNVHVGGSDSNDAQPNPPVGPPVVPMAGGVPDAPGSDPPVSALHVDAPPGGWHSVAPDTGPQVYEPAWPGDRQTQQTIGPVGSIHGDPSAVDPFRQALTKDCQEAAMVPVIQRATGEQVTDQALADQASRLASATPTGHPPLFTPMFDPVTGTNDANAQALLAVHGVPSTWLVPNNEADYLTQLERDLDAGYPVMVGVNEERLQNHAGYDSHEVLVTGVDDANNLIYYFDPWIGANTSAPVSVFTEACDHSMISTNPDRLPHVTLPTWPDDPPGDLGLPNPTDTGTTEFIDGTGATDTGATGTDTGATDTGATGTDTGATDTGATGTDTGATDTGATGTDTGATDIGATDTDTTEFIDGTGATDTGATGTDTGATDIGATDTDTTEFIDGTGATDTGATGTDTGATDTGATDTDTTDFIDGTSATDTGATGTDTGATDTDTTEFIDGTSATDTGATGTDTGATDTGATDTDTTEFIDGTSATDTGATDTGTGTAGPISWMTGPSAANDPLFNDPGPTGADTTEFIDGTGATDTGTNNPEDDTSPAGGSGEDGGPDSAQRLVSGSMLTPVNNPAGGSGEDGGPDSAQRLVSGSMLTPVNNPAGGSGEDGGPDSAQRLVSGSMLTPVNNPAGGSGEDGGPDSAQRLVSGSMLTPVNNPAGGSGEDGGPDSAQRLVSGSMLTPVNNPAGGAYDTGAPDAEHAAADQAVLSNVDSMSPGDPTGRVDVIDQGPGAQPSGGGAYDTGAPDAEHAAADQAVLSNVDSMSPGDPTGRVDVIDQGPGASADPVTTTPGVGVPLQGESEPFPGPLGPQAGPTVGMPLQGESEPFPGPLGPQAGPTVGMPLQGESEPFPGPLGPQAGPTVGMPLQGESEPFPGPLGPQAGPTVGMPLQGESEPFPGPLGPQAGPTVGMPLQGESEPFPGPLGPQAGPTVGMPLQGESEPLPGGLGERKDVIDQGPGDQPGGGNPFTDFANTIGNAVSNLMGQPSEPPPAGDSLSQFAQWVDDTRDDLNLGTAGVAQAAGGAFYNFIMSQPDPAGQQGSLLDAPSDPIRDPNAPLFSDAPPSQGPGQDTVPPPLLTGGVTANDYLPQGGLLDAPSDPIQDPNAPLFGESNYPWVPTADGPVDPSYGDPGSNFYPQSGPDPQSNAPTDGPPPGDSLSHFAQWVDETRDDLNLGTAGGAQAAGGAFSNFIMSQPDPAGRPGSLLDAPSDPVLDPNAPLFGDASPSQGPGQPGSLLDAPSDPILDPNAPLFGDNPPTPPDTQSDSQSLINIADPTPIDAHLADSQLGAETQPGTGAWVDRCQVIRPSPG